MSSYSCDSRNSSHSTSSSTIMDNHNCLICNKYIQSGLLKPPSEFILDVTNKRQEVIETLCFIFKIDTSNHFTNKYLYRLKHNDSPLTCNQCSELINRLVDIRSEISCLHPDSQFQTKLIDFETQEKLSQEEFEEEQELFIKKNQEKLLRRKERFGLEAQEQVKITRKIPRGKYNETIVQRVCRDPKQKRLKVLKSYEEEIDDNIKIKEVKNSSIKNCNCKCKNNYDDDDSNNSRILPDSESSTLFSTSTKERINLYPRNEQTKGLLSKLGTCIRHAILESENETATSSGIYNFIQEKWPELFSECRNKGIAISAALQYAKCFINTGKSDKYGNSNSRLWKINPIQNKYIHCNIDSPSASLEDPAPRLEVKDQPELNKVCNSSSSSSPLKEKSLMKQTKVELNKPSTSPKPSFEKKRTMVETWTKESAKSNTKQGINAQHKENEAPPPKLRKLEAKSQLNSSSASTSKKLSNKQTQTETNSPQENEASSSQSLKMQPKSQEIVVKPTSTKSKLKNLAQLNLKVQDYSKINIHNMNMLSLSLDYITWRIRSDLHNYNTFVSESAIHPGFATKIETMVCLAKKLFIFLHTLELKNIVISNKLNNIQNPVASKTSLTQINVSTEKLAKYFRLLMTTTYILSLDEAKKFEIALEIIKLRLIRLIKFYNRLNIPTIVTTTTTTTTTAQNINEENIKLELEESQVEKQLNLQRKGCTLMNICHFFKISADFKIMNDDSSDELSLLKNDVWRIDKALHIWDTYIVNGLLEDENEEMYVESMKVAVGTDHNYVGVDGFQEKLCKIINLIRKSKCVRLGIQKIPKS